MRDVFPVSGLLAFACICTGGCSGPETNPPALSAITSKAAQIEHVRGSLAKLGKATEPPTIWATVANDEGYGIQHRRLCVLELFRRHVRTAMSLTDLKLVLGNLPWLRDEDIHEITALAGLIPVRWTGDDTVFAIELLPTTKDTAPAVYLRVAGEVKRGDLVNLLMGGKPDSNIGSATLCEIGFYEP